MLRRLTWLEAACVAPLYLLRTVFNSTNDGRFRIECGLLLAEVARRWLGDFVLNFRRIELDGFAEAFIDHEQQSAVMRAEFLRVRRVRPITFGATFHFSFLFVFKTRLGRLQFRAHGSDLCCQLRVGRIELLSALISAQRIAWASRAQVAIADSRETECARQRFTIGVRS